MGARDRDHAVLPAVEGDGREFGEFETCVPGVFLDEAPLDAAERAPMTRQA